MLDAVLPTLISQGRGHISLLGSVAGYRGLPMSMAYGPTKAALHHLAEILHMELRPAGVGVSIVNPGFVATPLTAQNQFHMPALIQPEEAAREMLRGWEQGRFEIHFPRRFSRFLKFLRWLPDRLYFALVWRGTQGSLKR
jgi:short-subunit dehydrogenase